MRTRDFLLLFMIHTYRAPLHERVVTTDFKLVFNFEQTRAVTIFGEDGIMAHIP